MRALRGVGVQVLDAHVAAFAQLVGKRHALLAKSCGFGVDVVDAQAEMVEPGTAVRQEAHHRLLADRAPR